MMTREMRKITESPGKGYFHRSTRGAPTFVPTRTISRTPRPSCWKVAMRRLSSEKERMGLAECVQPALSVA